MSSIADARRALAAQFRDAGLVSPELDARILLGHALGMDHTALVAAATQPLAASATAAIAGLAARRLAGEPVARIVGAKEFWGLSFIVTPAVLVPRPETETVVELALALIDRQGRRALALRIADLGTGSGAILLALLSELPNARGVGTDIDPQALAAAADNARINGVPVEFPSVDALPRRTFDIVIANILANPLRLLAPTLAARTALGGKMALCGILSSQADDVIAAYADAVALAPWRSDDGWTLLAGTAHDGR